MVVALVALPLLVVAGTDATEEDVEETDPLCPPGNRPILEDTATAAAAAAAVWSVFTLRRLAIEPSTPPPVPLLLPLPSVARERVSPATAAATDVTAWLPVTVSISCGLARYFLKIARPLCALSCRLLTER